MIPQYVFEVKASNNPDHFSQVTTMWNAFDRVNQSWRDHFIKAIRRLDYSAKGDESTPWTAGDEYITGLYQIAHAVWTIKNFVTEHEDLLDMDKDARRFIFQEILKKTRQAVAMVEGGILAQERETSVG
jgi:hypothetical protein